MMGTIILVQGLYLFCLAFYDLFGRIPMYGIDSLLQGNLFTVFIDGNAGVNERLFLVVLAPADKKINTEGMCGLHDNFFDCS